MTAPERDFTDSLILAPMGVPLRKGRGHSLKSHARKGTLVREVLRTVDLWASNHPQRFVFAELSAILTECNRDRKKNGQAPYSLRHLKRVMAELQARHITSPYFKARDGRYGFVVEPHDHRCEVVNGVCYKHAPKRYEDVFLTPETAQRLRNVNRLLVPSGSPGGHGVVPELVTGWSPSWSPTGEKKVPELIPELVTSESVQPYDFSNFTDADAETWLAERNLNGAPKPCKSVSHGSPDAFKPVKQGGQEKIQEQGQPQEQPQRQEQQREGGSCSLERPTDVGATPTPPPMTVGEYFSVSDILDLMTDGQLEEPAEEGDLGWDDDTDWVLLNKCMREAVAVKAQRPYNGLLTNSVLMRDTMKLLRKNHGKNAPPAWLPIMDTLQGRTAEDKAATKLRKESRVLRASRFIEKPTDWHKANGYELCEDKIWRPQVSREAYGFTVKAANGLWCKP